METTKYSKEFEKGMQFLRKAKVLLKARGLKFSHIEEKYGYSSGYLSRCLSGKRGMSLDLALNISKELNMSIEEIMFFNSNAIKAEELIAAKKEIENKIESMNSEIDQIQAEINKLLFSIEEVPAETNQYLKKQYENASCEFCAFKDVEEYEEPCANCSHCYANKFVPE